MAKPQKKREAEGSPKDFPVSLIKLIILPLGLICACGLICVGGERTRPGTVLGKNSSYIQTFHHRYCISYKYRCAPKYSFRNRYTDPPHSPAFWL